MSAKPPNAQLQPLTSREVLETREFFKGPHSAERYARFVGWMTRSAEHSGKVADDIRTFMKANGGKKP